MNRRDYHREYRRAHLEIARATWRKSRAKRLQARWTRWLLATLEWPPEPDYIVPIPQPIRRPLLRLPRGGK